MLSSCSLVRFDRDVPVVPVPLEHVTPTFRPCINRHCLVPPAGPSMGHHYQPPGSSTGGDQQVPSSRHPSRSNTTAGSNSNHHFERSNHADSAHQNHQSNNTYQNGPAVSSTPASRQTSQISPNHPVTAAKHTVQLPSHARNSISGGSVGVARGRNMAQFSTSVSANANPQNNRNQPGRASDRKITPRLQFQRPVTAQQPTPQSNMSNASSITGSGTSVSGSSTYLIHFSLCRFSASFSSHKVDYDF